MRKNLRVKQDANGAQVRFSFYEGEFECGFGIGYGNSVMYPRELKNSQIPSIILRFIDNRVRLADGRDSVKVFCELIRSSPTLADFVLSLAELKTENRVTPNTKKAEQDRQWSNRKEPWETPANWEPPAKLRRNYEMQQTSIFGRFACYYKRVPIGYLERRLVRFGNSPAVMSNLWDLKPDLNGPVVEKGLSTDDALKRLVQIKLEMDE